MLDPEELEAAYELEALTNDRLRHEAGDIALVPVDQRIVGPGTSVIMAAFTHIHVESRFSNGNYGVYYAARSVDTALMESRHRRYRFLSATAEPACEVTMRCYSCDVIGALEDVRGQSTLHDSNSWTASQVHGAESRGRGEWGIHYDSVRHPGGECVAVFKPKALEPPVVQCGHYRYVWNGEAITDHFRVVGEGA